MSFLGATTDTQLANQHVREEQFRKFIEREVLKVLQTMAEDTESKPEDIQKIAQDTLNVIKPGMNLEELYKAAIQLHTMHSSLASIVITIMREYEEKYERKALNHVSQLMKENKYEDATDMIQKVLQYKMLGY